jgi:2-polyprenyl-3-methyl-5-hydroxy-6-metoxy-1,4-benzoquinol methylase
MMKKNNKNRHFSVDLFDDIDRTAKENDYFHPVLIDVEKFIGFKGKTVLDVGCGSGIFLSPFTRRFKEVVGIDGEISVAERAKSNGYKTVIKVQDFCIDELPIKDKSYDLVMCKDVFEHLIDPMHLLNQIYRVVKDGGYFLFHVPNHFPFIKRVNFLMSNNVDTFNFFPGFDSWTNPHIRFYNESDIMQRMSDVGFKLEVVLSYHFPAFPLSKRFGINPKIISTLQRTFPNQLNAGYTYLFRKV